MCPSIDHKDTQPLENNNSTTRNPLRTSLNLVKDGVTLAKPAVAVGFGFAHACVDFGFSLPRKLLPPLSLAHSITKQSLHFSSKIAQSSLEASDRMLSLAGAQDGESHVWMQQYIDSVSHTPGHEARQALLGVATLLVQVGLLDNEKNNPMILMQGASKLAVLHQEERHARIQKRREEMKMESSEWSSLLYMQYATAIYGAQAVLLGCCGGGNSLDDNDLIIPHPSELSSLSRHLRFAAAAYGAKSLKIMGVCDSLTYWTSDADAICQLCGIPSDNVVYMAQERHDLYAPAHFVAMDDSHHELILAIRGTQSLHDVLVDLACHNVEFTSVYDANDLMKASAHGGFLKSAQTLASHLHELVAETLQANPTYELVIVGHSLGGGVATLLALLWAQIPLFVSRNVRAISYASPCVVCSNISQAPFTRRHVTSVVTGDDVVSRFRLATFRELQEKLLQAAKNDNEDDVENTTSIMNGNDNVEMDESMDDTCEMVSSESAIPPLEQAEDEKLYCAGRVWWLQSKEYEPHPIVQVNPVKELNEIGLFPEMFAIHLPKAYMDSLEKLNQGQHDVGNDDMV
jgi:hypothetical protein